MTKYDPCVEVRARAEKAEAELKKQRNVDIEAVHNNAVKMEMLEAELETMTNRAVLLENELDETKAELATERLYLESVRNDYEALEAERDRLNAELSAEKKKNLFLNWLNNEWRKALEWYEMQVRHRADDNPNVWIAADNALINDNGKRARDALAGKEVSHE